MENENGIETERQKTTAEILAEYDSKVDLVEDKVCIKKLDGKTECFTGLNDMRICDGDDCYSETIPCEVCFFIGRKIRVIYMEMSEKYFEILEVGKMSDNFFLGKVKK